MIRSMTGFTRVTRSFEWGTLSLELSSVNHRYLEISPRLPREMASFEPLIAAKLRQGAGRGKLRCSADIHWAPQLRTASLDADLLSHYYSQLAELAPRLDGASPPSLGDLLSLPGVFESPERSAVVEEELRIGIESLLDEALQGLLRMRSDEGGNLRLAMEGYLESFERLVDALETSWAEKRDRILEETKSRITTLLAEASPEVDQGRVAQEIVLLSDKWDISEELVRSRSHIRQFEKVMNGRDSEGKKLDFLLQEMNREVNTIGSKVADAELRWMAVEAKAVLEKIREQVQNVE